MVWGENIDPLEMRKMHLWNESLLFYGWVQFPGFMIYPPRSLIAINVLFISQRTKTKEIDKQCISIRVLNHNSLNEIWICVQFWRNAKFWAVCITKVFSYKQIWLIQFTHFGQLGNIVYLDISDVAVCHDLTFNLFYINAF